MNGRRVLGGGLLAGLVYNLGETLLNAVVLAAPLAEIARAHALRPPSGRDIGLFVFLGFLLGIVLVWLYAAVRPRLGAGPRAAVLVGTAIWVPASLLPSVAWWVFGLSTLGLAASAAAWGLGELTLAALAGAWLYREP
jgi:hypothetical protein